MPELPTKYVQSTSVDRDLRRIHEQRRPTAPYPHDETVVFNSAHVVFISVALIFLIITVWISFPDISEMHRKETRYMLALFASCFTLGISDWFNCKHSRHPELGALSTIIMLLLLTGFWSTLLSGEINRYVDMAVVAIDGIRLK
jgi:hypothetical protein